MPKTTLRDAGPEDADLAANFILELATHEHLLNETQPDVEKLRRDLSPDANPRLYGIIAESDSVPIAFAAYYLAYSTNHTAWSIHLQDIFVREPYRGQGIGALLVHQLAQIAKEKGYEAIELEVLTWNKDARQFYEHLGFVANPEATNMYLEGETLDKLSSNKLP